MTTATTMMTVSSALHRISLLSSGGSHLGSPHTQNFLPNQSVVLEQNNQAAIPHSQGNTELSVSVFGSAGLITMHRA